MAKANKQLKKLQKALPKRTRKALKRYISPTTLSLLTSLASEILADYMMRRKEGGHDARSRRTLGPAME